MSNHVAATERQERGSQPYLKEAASKSTRLSRWLKESVKDGPIALFTCAAIVAHFFLRYVWRVGSNDLLPLYLALLAGGIPLLIGLTRQLFKLEFGSDLAGVLNALRVTLQETQLSDF
jgi:hypothetical protein